MFDLRSPAGLAIIAAVIVVALIVIGSVTSSH